MVVECKCGCKITLSNPKFKIEQEPGVPMIAIPCPNCNKRIVLAVIDMDEQTLKVTDSKTGDVILSFKEDKDA